MKYLRIIKNEIIYPYNLNQLKNEYLNTSFPLDISQTDLNLYDIYEVNEILKPSDENFSKIITEGTPLLIKGEYFQNWVIEDASSDYTNTFLSSSIESEWETIKMVRNQYLKETDWTQLFDSPLIGEVKENWIQYRQSLRDITDQEDPFNIIWPVKPE